MFDGPGQGEAEYDWPIRGNYETAVTAVCDYIETRADLDAARIGLWGVSLGGYYAPRAAAFEPRIRACVALSGPYDMGAHWDSLPELTREALRVRSHARTDEAGRANALTLSLAGVTERIACPLYIVAGKLDRVIPWQDAERLAREASGPVVFSLIEDGGHVANNRGYKWRSADGRLDGGSAGGLTHTRHPGSCSVNPGKSRGQTEHTSGARRLLGLRLRLDPTYFYFASMPAAFNRAA